MFCAHTMPRYQVSVYRTVSALVYIFQSQENVLNSVLTIDMRLKSTIHHVRSRVKQCLALCIQT